MDNVYVYVTTLPPKIREFVTPCADGYTVYISDRLDRKNALTAYFHALRHIRNDDFNSDDDIQGIEQCTHN